MTSKLNLHQDTSVNLVKRVTENTILIQNTEYTRSLIVTPTQVFSWDIKQIDSLNKAHFLPIFDLPNQPELLILGTGLRQHFPSPEQTQSLIDAQIGLEVMDTAAACRTYNILADDGRKVVACLLL